MLALLIACRSQTPLDLPVHTLAFGGDFMLGRQLNEALAEPGSRDAVLGGLAPLRTADLALINGEGVISTGGMLVSKGEDAPHTWRVGPEAVELLARAGVDVVSFGNNHAGDYGPAALREGIERLRQAGLDATGAGLDLADAETPVYRRVGDTVVAFVGVDLTTVRAYAATADRPGTLSLRGDDPARQDAVVTRLAGIAAVARRHAHVVLLTPHWGPNWRTEPLPVFRALARRLLAAGYDGILGHSAHTLQGVELLEGKPVIYDAGNLSITYGKDDAAHRAMLYELSFTRAGITEVHALPLAVRKNQTTVATGPVANRILAEWDERTAALGTAFVADGAARRIACDPGPVEGPRGASEPPRRTASEVSAAPGGFTVDALPPEATPTSVVWPNGVELVGYHLLVPTVGAHKAAQVVTLYFRSDVAQARDLMIQLVAFDGAAKSREGHWPGDWAVPGDQWPVGKILVDRTLFSFDLPPERGIGFGVGLGVAPVSSALPLREQFAVLGSAAFEVDAPTVNDLLPRPAP